MRLPKRQRIRVHLTSGRSFDGVLLDSRGGYLTLADARFESKGEWVPADGNVLLPRSMVEWVQA